MKHAGRSAIVLVCSSRGEGGGGGGEDSVAASTGVVGASETAAPVDGTTPIGEATAVEMTWFAPTSIHNYDDDLEAEPLPAG